MTTLADPYPPDLASLDDAPAITPNPDAVMNRLIANLARVAEALEQHTLALLHPANPNTPLGVVHVPAPVLAALPPVQGLQQAAQTAGGCPIHNVPWKTVPAGISKKTGQPYTAFQACSVSGCDQRPPR